MRQTGADSVLVDFCRACRLRAPVMPRDYLRRPPAVQDALLTSCAATGAQEGVVPCAEPNCRPSDLYTVEVGELLIAQFPLLTTRDMDGRLSEGWPPQRSRKPTMKPHEAIKSWRLRRSIQRRHPPSCISCSSDRPHNRKMLFKQRCFALIFCNAVRQRIPRDR